MKHRNQEPELELPDVLAEIERLEAGLVPAAELPEWQSTREENRRRVASDLEYEKRMAEMGIALDNAGRIAELKKLFARLEADRPAEAEIARLEGERVRLEIRAALEGRADGIPDAPYAVRLPRADYFEASQGALYDPGQADPSRDLPEGVREPFAAVAAVYAAAVARVLGACGAVGKAAGDLAGCETPVTAKHADGLRDARLSLVSAAKASYGDLRRGLRAFILADAPAAAGAFNARVAGEARRVAAEIAGKAVEAGMDRAQAEAAASDSEAVRRIAANLLDEGTVKAAVVHAEGKALQLAAEIRALIETELASLA